jgi:hypothetical protein
MAKPRSTKGSTAPNSTHKSRAQMEAELFISPVFHNADVARAFSGRNYSGDEITKLDAAVDVVARGTRKVVDGDLRELEGMLTAQAYALNSIFTDLAARAAVNIGPSRQTGDMYLRLAFKAQAQCRATVAALAEIKNPRPLAFVKQANIAQGPQQVNNGLTTAHRAPAGISENPSNELLEVCHGERLDIGAAGAASGANQELATMGALDGTEDRGREGK